MQKNTQLNSNILKTIILLLWVGLFFGTLALGFESEGWHSIYSRLNTFYNTGTGNGFPGFEFISFLFCFFLLATYHKCFSKQKYHIRNFQFITFIFVVLALLNPNNHLVNGLTSFLTMRISRSIIFLLAFTLIILFINTFYYEKLVIQIIRTGLKVGLVKASFDLIFFILGHGALNSFGRTITTPGGDVQLWFAIFEAITFAVFLYTRNKYFLLYSILFLICLLFSYQRTAVLITLIFDFVFYLLYQYHLGKNFFKIFNRIIIALVFLVLLILLLQNTTRGKDLIYRYSAALSFTGVSTIPESNDPEYSDSGHLLQSRKVTNYMLDNLDNFWGGGINRREDSYLHLEGQSKGGVHSNIASMWQYFGIPGILYYLFIFLFFLSYFIKILKSQYQITFYNYMLLALSTFYMIRMIAGWFSGDFFYMFVQSIFQFVLIISAFKLYNLKSSFISETYHKNNN